MNDALFSMLSKPGPDHFVIEGRWNVEAALENEDIDVIGVFRAKGSHEDFDPLYLHLTDIYTLDKASLSRAMGFDFHRGILAVAKRPAVLTIPQNVTGLFVALPEIADASNLGAIVRSAAALGASGVLLEKGRGADPWSRKSIRASSGAVFRLPIYECAALDETVLYLRDDESFTILSAALSEESIGLAELKLSTLDQVIVFGPEKGGLSEKWTKMADASVKIPMRSGMDSLNVAASAAIVIYELMKVQDREGEWSEALEKPGEK